MKRNNPLNIRFNSENNWLGQVGNQGGFVEFQSSYYGRRAAYRLILHYIKDGCDTLDDILHRFAPPSENSTQSYINFVIAKFGNVGLRLYPGTSFFTDFTTFRSRLQIAVLLWAMEWFENGSSEFTLQEWFDFTELPKIYNMIKEFEQ